MKEQDNQNRNPQQNNDFGGKNEGNSADKAKNQALQNEQNKEADKNKKSA